MVINGWLLVVGGRSWSVGRHDKIRSYIFALQW